MGKQAKEGKQADPVLKTARGEMLRFKSPAEFFSENKNIAGFDNPGKSLYTTIRELVENSLDACESVETLPDIFISLQEIGAEELHKQLGITTHSRLDQSLFGPHASTSISAKKKASGSEPLAVDTVGPDAKPSGKHKSETVYYRVTVRDNGCGMKHEQIPNFLGRVLSGSKYGVRQTRGKFGLGAKMALIWSKQSTGMPVEVRSATSASKPVSVCVLDIDIQKNEPRVKVHEQVPNETGMRGTEISLVVGGNWSTYRSYIVRYLRQMAVITPYGRFRLDMMTQGGNTLALEYARRSEEMPRPPQTIKHHPSSVHVELLASLLRDSKETLLHKFLSNDLSCVSASLAAKLIKEMRLPREVLISELEQKQQVALAHLLHEVQFATPSGECLSPVGEYNLRLGIMKELRPELVATFQDTVCSHEGHPLIVEAGVCLGGRDAKPGLTVYRFANRIPLLFEGGADVATQVSKRRINWGAYKIRMNQDKIGIFVSTVSTKVPFKGTSKEYIGDDIPEVKAAVKRALERCCLQVIRNALHLPCIPKLKIAPAQLKTKLAKQRALADERERRKNLTKYIPDVSRALYSILSSIALPAAEAHGDTASSRSKRPAEHDALLTQIREKKLKEEDLSEKLRLHVEQYDQTAALEQVAATGGSEARTDVYFSPLNDSLQFLPAMHHQHFVLQLQSKAFESPG